MIIPSSGTALVTHLGCMDGTGCAMVFILAGGRRDRIFFRTPSKLTFSSDELPDDVTEVWFADCCPSDMGDPCCGLPFKVFDHHVSNQRRTVNDDRCVFDMNCCGTTLLARELKLTGHKRLLDAIEAYDLGHFENIDGQYLADLAATLSQEHFLDHLITLGSKVFDNSLQQDMVMAASRMRNLYAKKAAKSALFDFLEISGIPHISCAIPCAITTAPVDWKNSTAEELFLNSAVELVIIIDTVSGMVSLRSRPGGVDCSMIASRFGGGGHMRAAGFKVGSKSLLRSLFEESFQ